MSTWVVVIRRCICVSVSGGKEEGIIRAEKVEKQCRQLCTGKRDLKDQSVTWGKVNLIAPAL